jgi:hypothetical protein
VKQQEVEQAATHAAIRGRQLERHHIRQVSSSFIDISTHNERRRKVPQLFEYGKSSDITGVQNCIRRLCSNVLQPLRMRVTVCIRNDNEPQASVGTNRN